MICDVKNELGKTTPTFTEFHVMSSASQIKPALINYKRLFMLNKSLSYSSLIHFCVLGLCRSSAAAKLLLPLLKFCQNYISIYYCPNNKLFIYSTGICYIKAIYVVELKAVCNIL